MLSGDAFSGETGEKAGACRRDAISQYDRQSLSTGSGQESRLYLLELTNEDVLHCLKENIDHPKYNERWADIQRLHVRGTDARAVLDFVARQYPANEGFRVIGLTAVPELDSCMDRKGESTQLRHRAPTGIRRGE